MNSTNHNPSALLPATIDNAIPAQSVALIPEAVAMINARVDELSAITIVDAATLAAKDAAYQALKSLRTSVEENRVAVKAPALERCRLIDAAAQPALKYIDEAILRGRLALQAWNDERKRLHAEAMRKAEAERIAEQKRLDAIAKAEADRLAAEQEKKRAEEARIAAEQHAKQVKEAQEKHAAEQQRVASLAELMGEAAPEPAPAPVIAPPPEPPKQAPPQPVPQAQVAKAAFVAGPVTSSAIASRKVKKAFPVNIERTPYKVNGIVLFDVREKDIANLLKANVEVPGWELREVESTTSR